MSRNAYRTWLLKITVTFAAVLVCFGLSSRAANADELAVMKISEMVKLDAVGNANINLTITAPTNLYTTIKSKNPNVGVLLRRLGNGRNWAILENVDGKFNDLTSSVEINYRQRGFSRIIHGSQWTVPLAQAGKLDLIDLHGNTAIFNKVVGNANGLGNQICRVICPDGATQLKHDANAKTLTYDFEPKASPDGRVDTTFEVDHKDTLMSCLAKVYSNEHFASVWAARSRFDNTGSTVLTDYRVRFRIAGYGSWSPWNHTGKVYPGQTVVDPFFPVFDVDKLNAMTGTRPAMLEVEYQYRKPNGQLVEENDSRRLQILGTNETIFSGLDSSDMMNLGDQMENMPLVLASFTTPGDPVIQELVGRVCGMAQCGGAAYSNDNTFKFLRGLYDFMVSNQIAYQSPPSFVDGSHMGQHIKYGRDVLRNHSGTCVDLAILWASICEAVGLKPVLIVIPGHCFIEVNLPNGQVTAVETTGIGKIDFDKAVQIGLKELQEARSGESVMTDIFALRKEGITSVDLPNVSPNYLAELGYRFERARTQTVVNTPEQTPVQPTTTTPATPTTTSQPASPVGSWEFKGQFPNGSGEIGLVLKQDGRMALVAFLHKPDGQYQELKGIGHWSVEGNLLVLADQTGTNKFQFSMQNGQLAVNFPALNTTIQFNRA